MQTLDYVKNIIFHKKKHTSKNIEDLKTYNPFMVNRWVSMFDGESANIINQTSNKINYFNNDKEMQYKMLLNVVPKKKSKMIDYIKKQIEETIE